jgi:peroxiredoxin
MPDPAGASYLGGKLEVKIPLDVKQSVIGWRVEEADNAAVIQVTVPGATQDRAVLTSLKINPTNSEIISWRFEERGADALVRSRQVTYGEVKFDADVADEKFAYTPPADSRKVEKVSDAGAVRLQKHIGKALPDIELTQLDGAKVKLDDLTRGSVTLVCLWRSYHPDCTLSVHHFNVLHEKFGEQGLKILLVSDETRDELSSYFHSMDDPQPSWDGAFYSAASKLGEPYTLSSHSPTSLLVDRKGVLRKVFLGVAMETARYEPDIEALLEESDK